MRITKALPALVLLLALVAGTASAYISENPRQGLAPISAEFHQEPTTRNPGLLLGFELRFLGFCVRSGLSYIDPFGLDTEQLDSPANALDELLPRVFYLTQGYPAAPPQLTQYYQPLGPDDLPPGVRPLYNPTPNYSPEFVNSPAGQLAQAGGEIIVIGFGGYGLGAVSSELGALLRLTRRGSGPASGFLEVSDYYSSSRAVQRFGSPRPTDFIFDQQSQRFIMGRGPLGHDSILHAGGISPSENIVGGRIFNQGGRLFTDEWSGHYGQNWTPQIRQQFQEFMRQHSVDITHVPWGQ